ncbi:MAG: hypothetical protein Ct9H300mP28_35090 [Pseudomonadota bacterium]|nr:MAG: hypothetical protein Ct9H300mP28_35090 [Pseudomonadota bacterium]
MTQSRSHIWFVSPAVLLMFVILILPICCRNIFFTDYNLGSQDLGGLDGKIMSPGQISSYKKCSLHL